MTRCILIDPFAETITEEDLIFSHGWQAAYAMLSHAEHPRPVDLIERIRLAPGLWLYVDEEGRLVHNNAIFRYNAAAIYGKALVIETKRNGSKEIDLGLSIPSIRANVRFTKERNL